MALNLCVGNGLLCDVVWFVCLSLLVVFVCVSVYCVCYVRVCSVRLYGLLLGLLCLCGCLCLLVCFKRVLCVKRCMLLHDVLFVMVPVVCEMFKQRLCVIVWCSVACCLLFFL